MDKSRNDRRTDRLVLTKDTVRVLRVRTQVRTGDNAHPDSVEPTDSCGHCKKVTSK